MTSTAGTTESVGHFAARARTWIEDNLPTWDDEPVDDRTLQNRIYDAGFGGIAFPVDHGGAGLTLAHQRAFYDCTDELGRQVPRQYWVSIGMVAPLLLERGSEAQKREFLPQLLRGDIIMIQLLSEPRGGSDLAGATTRLTRTGDHYVLSGSKMWSTNAYIADYGICLARSNWSVPKHRGLSLVIVPLKDDPGVSVHRTRMADGELGDVCEEFFDDVVLPRENLIGDEDDGWAVVQSLMVHERNQTADIGYGRLGAGGRSTTMVVDRTAEATQLAAVARERAALDLHNQAVADAYIDSVVTRLTGDRIIRGLALGTHQGPWGSLGKLRGSEDGHRVARTRLAVLGADGVTWDGDDVQPDNAGTAWLTARIATIGGGTSEIQRNIISERLLGLPREPSFDRDVPFEEVLRNARRRG
ncbi:acyl-CoA dehydrogenase family protein [Blastococcus sp. URHD0036]|uniref:acyl-CoA dehydrogenase family protein n=1 Tax=Blastococcus sp. URHD0036 TaxID=1380356 RepID=UPI00049778EB|nr:acyl-CoA dehydrogenase family protein [Blastococcus sp. URHD0036]